MNKKKINNIKNKKLAKKKTVEMKAVRADRASFQCLYVYVEVLLKFVSRVVCVYMYQFSPNQIDTRSVERLETFVFSICIEYIPERFGQRKPSTVFTVAFSQRQIFNEIYTKVETDKLKARIYFHFDIIKRQYISLSK